MRTISNKVSKREHAGILEFANQTGESVSNLIRKVLINEAVCTDSFDNVPEDYHVNRYTVDMEEKDEDNVLIEKINEIRVSLGWEQIGLGENEKSIDTKDLDEQAKSLKE